MNIDRRKLIRLFGAAPAAALVMDAQSKMNMAGLSPLQYGGLGGHSVGPPNASGDGHKKFTSFAKWWAEYGQEDALRAANNVHALDPDIVELHLPLLTKVRMQRGRNIERIKIERERDFIKSITGKGFWEWWA